MERGKVRFISGLLILGSIAGMVGGCAGAGGGKSKRAEIPPAVGGNQDHGTRIPLPEEPGPVVSLDEPDFPWGTLLVLGTVFGVTWLAGKRED